VHIKGFTYLGLLFAVALAGVALALAGVVWQTASKRAKEEQLLFAGGAIRDAIIRYYRSTPGGDRQFPRTLQDLVEDPRYVTHERHLRKIYLDPITGKRDWGLIKGAEGRIMGVYSQSRETPIKREKFPATFASFEHADRYSDWRFTAEPEDTPASNAERQPVESINNSAVVKRLPPRQGGR
jgi:type II secretory pathway pseudopilin PulG